ncbi:hypothetical protein ACFZDK_03940 [Streptomyces sp. NPDC007901]|uniref:hypothetical protein n=1 Tax=Streptomyces sp. NPDC007901 TaxID=3364785 RepID=UPI0036EC283F
MTVVHALIHLHDFDDGSADFKLIGVYSSEGRAARARAVSAGLPGFRDSPDGYDVLRLEVEPAGAEQGPLPGELHLLFRILESDRGEEVLVLGAFRSEERARAAASAYAQGPPEAELEVAPVGLDESTWTDGFFTCWSDEQ